jgi:uncharacterized membrane protein
MSTDNVLVITFGEQPADDTNAYQALTDLKELDSQHQIEIAGAAVISRDLDGRVEVKSEISDDPYMGTASGGLIGLLVGIIGGPLLGEISKQVHPTRTAVLAQVTEQSPEVVDAAMARLGGEVMRRPSLEVEQEIAAAEDAQRRADREARKELHQARVEKTKEEAHAKVEELKSKLHRTNAGAAA